MGVMRLPAYPAYPALRPYLPPAPAPAGFTWLRSAFTGDWYLEVAQ